MRYSLPALGYLVLFAIVTIGTTNRLPAQYPGVLTIVHKTGDPIIDSNPTGAGNTGPILDLGQGPSINDAGKVAFIARDKAGNYGRVLLVTPAGVFDRNFPLTSLQVIGEELEVNNKDQVCWQDQVLTNGDTFIRRLDSNAGGATIAIGSTFFTTPFRAVSPFGVTIDDTGRVTFTGTLLKGGTVLASRNGGSGSHNMTPAVSASLSYYAMIANNGATIVRYGSSTTSPLRKYSDIALTKFATIAAPPTFQAIAAKPGISDDGALTCFLAVHSTLGVAVYGHLAGGPSLITIASTTGNSPISSISSLKRVSVNRAPSPSGTIYRTAYVAKSTSNVIGLYTSDVDVSKNPVVVTPPTRIVQVGDSVRGLTGTVTDIDMYDALNTKGEIVFWVKTSTNQQAILRGTLTSIEVDDGASVGINGFLYAQNGRITKEPAKLAIQGEQRTGLVADGVSRVLIRVRTASKGTVSVGFKTAATGSGSLAVPGGKFGQQALQIPTVPTNDGQMAFFVYLAPMDFVRKGNEQDKQGAERQVVLSYSFSPQSSTSKYVFENSLVIHRPPVVFCHGLWSDASTWKDETSNPGFGALASGKDTRFPKTIRVNYGATAGASFALNATFVTRYIAEIIAELRADKIACAQVDWVGHSMGAVLPRYEYRLSTVNRAARPWNRPDNFEAGDIHKIILLNSPQWGSPWANLAFALKEQSAFFRSFMAFTGRPLQGAIEDLQEGSDAYKFIGETPFHARAIVSTGLEKTLGAAKIGFDVAGKRLPSPWNAIFTVLGIVTNLTIDQVYRNEKHDLIVLAASQGAGLATTNTSPLMDLLKTNHIYVTGWDTAANKVVELLNAPLTDFSQNMPKPNLNPKGSFGLSERLVEPLFDGVGIRTASGAKFVEPGKAIVLEVVGKNNFVPAKVSVVTFWDFQQSTTKPFRATLTVPREASGEVSFMALGEDSAKKYAYSKLFTLPVKLSAKLTRITTPLSDVRLFEPNQTMHLFVEGSFDDNVKRDVTKAITGTKYTSSSPSIASVTADGIITALKEGQTKITITNTGTTMSLVVAATVEYGPVRLYGEGTVGAGAFVPQLHAGSQQPKVGTTFRLQVDKALGGAAGLLLAAPRPAELPLFGGKLLVDPTVNLVMPLTASGSVGVPGAGSVTLPIRIPNNKNLVGASGYLQAGFSDKGAIQGVSLSNGLFVRAIQ